MAIVRAWRPRVAVRSSLLVAHTAVSAFRRNAAKDLSVRDHRAEPVGRLTKRPDFVAAASGRRFHTDRMTVQGRLRDDASPGLGLRVGLTVTKRVGHATERNRIKRRLRTAYQRAGVEHSAVNADIVVIGRRDILTAEYATLIDDLQRALRIVTKPKGPRAGERPRDSSPPPTDGDRRGSTHAPGQ